MKKVFLDQANEYIETKRNEIKKSREHYGEMIINLQNSFEEIDVGVNSIKLGEEVIVINDINNPEKISYKEELFWIDKLKKGKSLTVITISNGNVGYYGKENLSFSEQPLENLIDIEIVKKLAPNAKIYAPKDVVPWPSIIYSSSFKIFITEKYELEALKKNIKAWVKTEWHDKISETQKYSFKAENVFCVTVYSNFTEDINQKIDNYNQAKKDLETLELSSEWSAVSQSELKKSLASLLKIEEHPKFGRDIQRIIKEIAPMLSFSMREKQEMKIARKKVDKAYNDLYKNMNISTLNWHDFNLNI